MGSLSDSQMKVLALIPKLTGSLSLFGSVWIIKEILRKKSKRGKVYHRLLLGMSICDVFGSTNAILSSWPSPKGTPDTIWAVGNIQTCTFQGTINQIGIAVPIYSASLSIFYMLVIVYGWSDIKFRRGTLDTEKILHLVPLSFAMLTNIASLILDLFNNAGSWCWISGYPLLCEESHFHDGVTNCERGDNWSIYRWAFWYVPLWFCFIIIVVLLRKVYRTVKEAESSTARHGRLNRNRNQNHYSRKVANQCLAYVIVFYAVWMFPTINRITELILDESVYTLSVLHAFFEPAQGFLNFIVYVRPRYLRYRERHPLLSDWEVTTSVMGISTSSIFTRKRPTAPPSRTVNTDASGLDNTGETNDEQKLPSRGEGMLVANQGSPSSDKAEAPL